ncbi:hypothetical protein A5881_003956 [Enterococcus termitis]
MNNYGKTLKYIREGRKISQSKMLKSRDRSQYSRIENDKSILKVETLEYLCEKLGVSLAEFVSLNHANDFLDSMVLKFRECAREPNNLEKKQSFLESFKIIDDKSVIDLSRMEYNFKYTVRAVLPFYWKDMKPLTQTEVDHLYEHLIGSSFFGQYDYMLAMNIAKLLNKEQMARLADIMYPVQHYATRNDLTKQYSNLLITNAISYFIFEEDYPLALEYVEKAQKNLALHDSYYLHLNLLFHKNLTLSLLKKETKYIEKTREIIRIIHDIGDLNTAKVLETELNNLIHFPNYYTQTKQISEVTAST